jgi:hypothetical protein
MDAAASIVVWGYRAEIFAINKFIAITSYKIAS